MSTLRVTTISTANATTNQTINTGNSAGPYILLTAATPGVVIASNSSTNAIVVDAGANVGIGTSSPAWKSHVAVTGATTSAYNALTSNSSSANYGSYYLGYNTNSSMGNYAGFGLGTGVDGSNLSNGYFTAYQTNYAGSYVQTLFTYNYTLNNWSFSTAGTQRLNIDSSGRVTKPYQPAWAGQTSSFSGTVTGSPNHTSGINYGGGGMPNGSLLNIGSHWNTTTGRFTAPVAGCYLIGLISSKDVNTTARDNLATFSINGSYYEAVELYGPYADGGASLVVYLNVNDWVEAGRNNGFTAGTNRVTFYGYFLG